MAVSLKWGGVCKARVIKKLFVASLTTHKTAIAVTKIYYIQYYLISTC